MADPDEKLLPDDGMEQTRRLLDDMDATMRRVRLRILDRPAGVAPDPDDADKKD